MPGTAASRTWWIRATLNPVECAVISAFDFGTDDESPLRTADTTARVPDKTAGVRRGERLDQENMKANAERPTSNVQHPMPNYSNSTLIVER